MTLMGYVMIGLAICMVLGPILILKPTPRQQVLARLRSRAPSLGLKVHLTRLDDEQIAVYQLPWPAEPDKRYAERAWTLERKKYKHDLHLCQYWYWQDAAIPDPRIIQRVTDRLPDLPDSVKGVAGNNQGISCYWEERGGDDTLDQIAGWLAETREVLWPLVQKKQAHKKQPDEANQEDHW